MTSAIQGALDTRRFLLGGCLPTGDPFQGLPGVAGLGQAGRDTPGRGRALETSRCCSCSRLQLGLSMEQSWRKKGCLYLPVAVRFISTSMTEVLLQDRLVSGEAWTLVVQSPP